MLKPTLLDRGQLINRLTAQIGSRAKAIAILQKRGHLAADGKTLTPEGHKRNAMTASERAIDRVVKRTGKPANHFYYDQFKNSVKLFNNERGKSQSKEIRIKEIIGRTDEIFEG